MATEVDICNLALGHVGDTAAVTSIDPPDGSRQASLCARFYPMARNSLLEMHSWGFATKRAALVLLDSSLAPSQWAYAYQAPETVANYLDIFDPLAADDISQTVNTWNMLPYPQVQNGLGIYTPQPFSVETVQGQDVIYTNQQDAVLRYTAYVDDPALFSALFMETLSYWLGSKLAGPIIKGMEGRQVAKELAQIAMTMRRDAILSDANQRRMRFDMMTPWMVGR